MVLFSWKNQPFMALTILCFALCLNFSGGTLLAEQASSEPNTNSSLKIASQLSPQIDKSLFKEKVDTDSKISETARINRLENDISDLRLELKNQQAKLTSDESNFYSKALEKSTYIINFVTFVVFIVTSGIVVLTFFGLENLKNGLKADVLKDVQSENRGITDSIREDVSELNELINSVNGRVEECCLFSDETKSKNAKTISPQKRSVSVVKRVQKPTKGDFDE